MKYLILAQYVKSGKKLWWCLSSVWRMEKGCNHYLPGTNTEVKIIDIIELTNEQYQLYKTVN